MRFRGLLSDLIAKYGQGTLAEKVGTDDSTLSRFRSGDGALKLEVIENICNEAQVVIVPVEEWEGMKDALARMAKLWIQERGDK